MPRQTSVMYPAVAALFGLLSVGFSAQAPARPAQFPAVGAQALTFNGPFVSKPEVGKYYMFNLCTGQPVQGTFEQMAGAGTVPACNYNKDNQLNVTGGHPAPYAFSLKPGDQLPPGLHLDPFSGIIYGTPTRLTPPPTVCVTQLNEASPENLRCKHLVTSNNPAADNQARSPHASPAPKAAGGGNPTGGSGSVEPSQPPAKGGAGGGHTGLMIATVAILAGGGAVAAGVAARSASQSTGGGGSSSGGGGTPSLVSATTIQCIPSGLGGSCTGSVTLNLPVTITSGTVRIQTAPSLFIGSASVTPGSSPGQVTFTITHAYLVCYPTQTSIGIWDGNISGTSQWGVASSIALSCQ